MSDVSRCFDDRIIVGDVRAALRTLPAESVHVCVTSPPYWSLRSYSTTPQLWGGDPTCAHAFDPEPTAEGYTGKRKWQHSSNGAPGWSDKSGLKRDGRSEESRMHTILNSPKRNSQPVSRKTEPDNWSQVTHGDTCRHCGAWRGELGGEPTPELYVEHIVEVFREVRRVLRRDGTVWCNLGDSFFSQGGERTYGSSDGGTGRVPATSRMRPSSGLKPKDLVGIPWRVAFALQADGWYLRSDIIWSKPNPMPESVTDRPTKSHEYLFMLTKSSRYYYDADAVREEGAGRLDLGVMTSPARLNQGGPWVHTHKSEPGRNRRSVWEIPTQPNSDYWRTSRRVPVGLDAIDDDTKRTASPDCPVHVGSSGSASSASSGERAARAISQRRNLGSDTRHVQAPLDVIVPIDPNPDAGLTVDNSDSLDPACSPAANSHNNGSRRTGLDPGTIQPYTLSAQTNESTADRPALPGFDGLSAHMPGNRNERDDSDAHPLAQTEPDSVRTLSCTCTYYKEVTESVSHFATYPERLVEPCILAGTSEWGVCRQCGAPWRRVVETHRNGRDWNANNRAGGDRLVVGQSASDGMPRNYRPPTTTGWRPTCTHPGDPIPATVLDPFLGSGTTARVAERLGRKWVGIELNENYAEIARRRTAQRGLFQFAAGGDG